MIAGLFSHRKLTRALVNTAAGRIMVCGISLFVLASVVTTRLAWASLVEYRDVKAELAHARVADDAVISTTVVASRVDCAVQCVMNRAGGCAAASVISTDNGQLLCKMHYVRAASEEELVVDTRADYILIPGK